MTSNNLQDKIEESEDINKINPETDNNKGAVEGKIYEKLVVAFLARKGYELENSENCKFRDFSLGREVNLGNEGKFDDAVFRYKGRYNKKTFICIQIKYMQKYCEINSNILSNGKLVLENKMKREFNLKKHFISYLKCKKTLKNSTAKALKNGRLKYVVIFTNCGLDIEELENNDIFVKKAENDVSTLFNLKKLPSEVKDCDHYQLESINNTLRETLQKSSDLNRIAEELANFVVWKKTYGKKIMRTDAEHIFMENYQVALEREVIIKSYTEEEKKIKQYCTAKFRADFVDNQEPGPKQELRDAILRFIKEKDPGNKNATDDTLKLILKNAEWKIKTDFGDSKIRGETLLKEWELVEEQDINNFLKSLVFVVNQPQIKQLSSINNELIQDVVIESTPLNHLLKSIKESINLELINCFENTLKSNKKEETWISGEEIINFVEKQKHEIFILFTVTIMSLLYKTEVTNYGKFENLRELPERIDDFLKNRKKIFYFCVRDTLLGSIKLFQYFETKTGYKVEDGNIFISIHHLEKENNKNAILKAFETKNRNLLIIECKQAKIKQNISELCKELSVIINKNHKKKIILITSQNENELVDFFRKKYPNDSQNFKEEEINLKDFKPHEDPFKKQIKFLGKEKTTLANLTDINDWSNYFNCTLRNNGKKISSMLINIKTLIEILHNENEIQIGSKPLGTSDLEGAYMESFEEINLESLVDKLIHDLKNFYIISTVNESYENILEELTEHLESNDKQKVKNNKNLLIINSNEKQTNVQSSIAKFKKLCSKNSEKKIYFIMKKTAKNTSKFILQRFYNPDFYFRRKFTKIVIKTDVKELFMLENCSDNTLIFSNITKKEQFIELFAFSNLDEKENFLNILTMKNIQLIAEENVEAIFENISEQNPGKTIHWFKVFNGKIIWIKSQGSLENLRKYIDKGQNKETLCNEEEFIEEIENKKVVIFADDPGMGKSTTVTKLYESKYKIERISLFESHWVIRINFKDHLQSIKKIECDNIDVIEFLSAIDVNLTSDLAKELLKLALDNMQSFSRPLLLIFDGFDEIRDEENRIKIISLLKFLRNETKSKLWITTRLHYAQILEEALNTFVTNFYPVDNHTKFIKKYFKDHLNLILSKENFGEIFNSNKALQKNTKLQNYCETFLKKMGSIFKGDISKFIGTPLQLHLMLEGSMKHFKNWVESNDIQLNFDYLGYNLLDIYKNYIEKKYEVYFKKVGIQTKTQKNQDKLIFDQCNKMLAKSLIFNFNCNQTLYEFKDTVLSAGIIVSRDQNVEFIHPTFAEYFAAEICIHWIEKIKYELSSSKKLKYLVEKILKNRNYIIIRNFLNSKLEKVAETRKLPNENLKQVGENIIKKNNSSPNHSCLILSTAVFENNKHIINFFLESLEKTLISKEILYDLLTPTDFFGRTFLHYTVLVNDDEMTEFVFDKLCEKFSKDQIYNFFCLQDDSKAVFLENMFRSNLNEKYITNSAIQTEYEKVIGNHILLKSCTTAILKKNRNINFRSIMISELKQKFPNTSNYGKTILHYAVQNSYYKTTELILNIATEMFSAKNLKTFLEFQDMIGNTALHYAAIYEDSKMIELVLNTVNKALHKCKFSILLNIKNQDDKNPQHYSPQVFKNLMKNLKKK